MTTSPLIRRFRERDGTVTTYLQNGELCRTVGIVSSTLSNWTKQGLVRCTTRLGGSRNYAVVDAARLKLMTSEEAESLGVRKTPDDQLVYQRGWYRETQEDTLKRAEYTREAWNDYDVEFLVRAVEESRPLEIIAKALGRTYAAIGDRIEMLRKAGDLPPVEHDEGWLERTMLLLTQEEVHSLQQTG